VYHWRATKDRSAFEGDLNTATFDIFKMFTFTDSKLFSKSAPQTQSKSLVGALVPHEAAAWLFTCQVSGPTIHPGCRDDIR